MTRVILVTDTHHGIRNDSPVFLDYFKKSLDTFLFPYMEKHQIKTLIHLGDIVHRRKFVNFQVAQRLRSDFLDYVQSKDIDTHIIAGNHDQFFKDTTQTNVLDELIGTRYSNVKYYLKPANIKVGGMDIALVPWITESPTSHENAMTFLKETPAQVVLGHLAVAGFEQNKGHIAEEGLDSSTFSKFDIVCSGHFHHKSSQGNIHYLGALCEHDWSCFDDPRGFTIFDTETRELTFIRNPNRMFYKIWYDDKDKTPSEIMNFDPLQYTASVIKVIVSNKTDHLLFDNFIEMLESVYPFDLQVVDDHLHQDAQVDEIIVEEGGDTIKVFHQYIDGMSDKLNKPRLTEVITDLHKRALSIE